MDVGWIDGSLDRCKMDGWIDNWMDVGWMDGSLD